MISMRMRDRKLMEEFEQKYTPQQLMNAMQAIKGNLSNGQLTDEELDTSDVGTSIPEAILLYIRKLEGYRIRLRELHWSAVKKSEHELTDTLMSELTDYEDSIAEESMGIFGVRIKVGDIVPVMPKSVDTKTLLVNLNSDTLTLLASLENEDSIFGGIPSILEDILHDVNSSRYLETLS